MEQTLMKQEQKKQAFSSFFEDCFSTRNIIENSIRNWKILVFFTLFGAVTAFALTQYVIRPIYSAQATVFAMNTEGRNDNRIYSNEVLVGQHLSYDYQQFMVSNRVQDKVFSAMEEQFRGKGDPPPPMPWYSVTSTNTRNTRLIVITAKAHVPAIAQAAANATAMFFAQAVRDMMKIDNVQILDEAKLPKRPINLKIPRNVAIGLFLGFAFGFLASTLLGLLDQTIKNPEQADAYFDPSLLGVIPMIKGKLPNEPLYSLLDQSNQHELAEAFRLARSNLPYLCPDAGQNNTARTFIFTSTAKGEGKSNCVSALALLTAKAGKKVLLIDADLRRPTIGKIFDLPQGNHGIVTYLAGESTFDEAVSRGVAEKTLDVVQCTKPLPPNPSEMLMSANFKRLLDEHRNEYDYIFVDCAPALFLADPLIVAPLVDAIIFVISCNRAKIPFIRKTLTQITSITQIPIGMLVNRFDRTDISCKYGYYRYKEYDRYYHYQRNYYTSND